MSAADYEAFGACAFQMRHAGDGSGRRLLGVLQPPLQLMTLEASAVASRFKVGKMLSAAGLDAAEASAGAEIVDGSSVQAPNPDAILGTIERRSTGSDYAELALAVLYIYCLLEK